MSIVLTLSLATTVCLIIILIQNVRKRRELEARVDKAALRYYDQLTNIPNRQAFMNKLSQRLDELEQLQQFAVIYLDVDNFKYINDTIGHSYGDELIIDLTKRLKDVLQKTEYMARFGGDSFMIMTAITDGRVDYHKKLNQIRNAFEQPFQLCGKQFFITVSIGITEVPMDGFTVQNVIKNADSALYKAKDLGKNRYCYFDNQQNQVLMQQIEIQTELRRAIDHQEFILFYQPQIDLESNRISGFEALIRWNHPTKGILDPKCFIQLAEETGLILPIGKWVLLEACRQLREWQNNGYEDIRIAVNFSARQFLESDIIALIEEAIQLTHIHPESLEIEITESIALKNVDHAIQTIQYLRKIGVQVSLDDFGTGYSSMNYLKVLPVSNLKIDKSFLDSILESKSDRKIVRMMIELAQALNLAVIAEGVESNEQAEFLRKIHCNKAQGFLYSKPIPDKEAKKFLETVYYQGVV